MGFQDELQTPGDYSDEVSPLMLHDPKMSLKGKVMKISPRKIPSKRPSLKKDKLNVAGTSAYVSNFT